MSEKEKIRVLKEMMADELKNAQVNLMDGNKDEALLCLRSAERYLIRLEKGWTTVKEDMSESTKIVATELWKGKLKEGAQPLHSAMPGATIEYKYVAMAHVDGNDEAMAMAIASTPQDALYIAWEKAARDTTGIYRDHGTGPLNMVQGGEEYVPWSKDQLLGHVLWSNYDGEKVDNNDEYDFHDFNKLNDHGRWMFFCNKRNVNGIVMKV